MEPTTPEEYIDDTEVQKDQENSFSGNRILADVIKKGLWRGKNETGDYLENLDDRIVNQTELVKIVNSERDKMSVDYSVDRELPTIDELDRQAKSLMSEGIDDLITDGVVTQEMVDLASKWIKTEDIGVIDDGEIGAHVVPLDIDDSIFPTGEKKPYITIPRKIITNKMNHYEDIGKNVGLVISEDNLLRVSLQSIAIHEWSHGLEKALQVQAFQNIKDNPNFNKADEWETFLARRDIVFANAPESPGLNPPDKKIESEAFIERFSSGFEFAITQIALEKVGYSPEDAKKFINEIFDQRKFRLNEFNNIRNNSGFDDDTLWQISSDINSASRSNGVSANVIESGTQLGYYAPYKKEELKEMLSGSMDSLSNPEMLQQLVDAKKSY